MTASRRIITQLSRSVPQSVAGFAYRHRFNPLVRTVRDRLLQGLGETRSGVPIPRGPLEGWLFAFHDSPAEWAGLHEPEIQTFLLSEIHPNDVVYDIGAHLGYYVLLAATVLRGEGRIVAYEPDPESFALLSKSVELNGCDDVVELRQLALSGRPGSARMDRSFAHSGQAVLEEGEGDVVVTTLDVEVLSNGMPAPTLIIIDTEGLEGEIFRGGWEVLARHRPRILAEHHGRRIELIAQLGELGYSSRELDADHDFFWSA